MSKPILMPQVGQDLTEGKLVELHVKVGDSVKKGDIVAVVESEKASFEVEAFQSGTVLEILYAEGDTTTVLEPLMFVGEPGEKPAAAQAPAEAAKAPEPAHAGGAPAAPPSAPPAAPAPAAAAPQRPGKRRSSPLARRLAKTNGLDLAGITGSGPGGSVVKRDVDAAIATRKVFESRPAAAAPAPQPAPVPAAAPTAAPFAMQGGQGPLAFKEMRRGVGAPLVLIHGFGGDMSAWRAFLNQLPPERAILALDLPAHGGSRDVVANGYDAVVESVCDTLLGAGVHSVHLCGHSLGGAVAASVAAAGLLDVRSLTLLAPAGLGAAINADYLRGFCAATDEHALAPWMGLLAHDPKAVGGALIRATAAARADAALVSAQSALAAALFPGGAQRFSIVEALEGFAGPARMIYGREDAILRPDDMEARVPAHVAAHRLRGVGHLPQLEAPAMVGRLIAETIRSAG